jgi:hypothetical protein
MVIQKACYPLPILDPLSRVMNAHIGNMTLHQYYYYHFYVSHNIMKQSKIIK